MKTIKGLFLDLDSTLIKTVSGKTFPVSPADWQWYNEYVEPTLRRHMDYGIFIVTNQGGIEKGFVNPLEFASKLESICQQVREMTDNSVPVQAYFCPSMVSYDRKPEPGMAFRAAIEHNLNLRESIMVGDMDSDRKFAENAGIGTFYHPDEFFTPYRPDLSEWQEQITARKTATLPSWTKTWTDKQIAQEFAKEK